MAYNSDRQSRNLKIVQKYLNASYVYNLNSDIAHLYRRFKAELIRHYGPKERQKLRKATLGSVGVSDNDL